MTADSCQWVSQSVSDQTDQAKCKLYSSFRRCFEITQMESNKILPAMFTSLEESTTERIPLLLEEIIKKVPTQCNTDSIQKDYLFVVILVSIIENGFVLVDNECQPIEQCSINTSQLSKWKDQSGVYQAFFVLLGFKNVLVKLIMSPLGAMVLVNAVINDLNSETYSVCLPVSKFVVSPQATTIPMIFRDLQHLSLALKNKVLAPVKSRILSYHGYASASLIGLPEELLFKILLSLQIKDVLSVTETCTTLNIVLQSDILWHGMMKRDFGAREMAPQSESLYWKEKYKASYIEKHNQSRRRTLQVSVSSDYVSYLNNPMWNVII